MREKIDTSYTTIYNRKLIWLDTGTSIKSDEVKLVLRYQTNSLKYGHASVFQMWVKYQPSRITG